MQRRSFSGSSTTTQVVVDNTNRNIHHNNMNTLECRYPGRRWGFGDSISENRSTLQGMPIPPAVPPASPPKSFRGHHYNSSSPPERLDAFRDFENRASAADLEACRRKRLSRQVSDPLGGGSLHSTLRRPPRRTRDFEGGRASLSITEGREPLLRKRPGRSLGVSNISGDLLDLESPSSPESNIPNEEKHQQLSPTSSPPRVRKSSHDYYDAFSGSSNLFFHPMVVFDNCWYGTSTVNKRIKGNKQSHRRSVLLKVLATALVALVCGGILLQSSHQVHEAQQALRASHQEKTSILAQMQWLDQRAKQNIGMGTATSATKNNPWLTTSVDDQKKMETLSSEVELLKMTIQQSSREQLQELFASSIQVEVVLDAGIGKEPLIIEISSQNESPYTAWTWLNQVRHGVWDKSTLRHVGNAMIEIHLLPSASIDDETRADQGDSLRDATLNFREDSILSKRREYEQQGDESLFMVGVRNSQNESEKGLVLTIHMEELTCGQDENEVCIGEIVDGFETLKKVDSKRGGDPISVVTAKAK